MRHVRAFLNECGYTEIENNQYLQTDFINQLDEDTEYSEADLFTELDLFLELTINKG